MWFLLLLAPSPAYSAPTAVPTYQAETPDPAQTDWKGAADGAIRWLRGRQAEDGSYGRGVADTAEVLIALADSPRAYRMADGPFVRRAVEYLYTQQAQDGSVADPEVNHTTKVEQTTRVLTALAQLDPQSDGTRRARAWRLVQSQAVLGEPLTPEAHVARALEALAATGADGFIARGKESVRATAIAVQDFAFAYNHFKQKPVYEQASRLPEFQAAKRAEAVSALQRGISYLHSLEIEGTPGRFGTPYGPSAGLTAMALGSLLCAPEPRSPELQASIDAGLDWLVSLQAKDGSIHDGSLKSYSTSAALLALARADREQDLEVRQRGAQFLVRLQADEGEGYGREDLYYGGIGYGGDERPDLSNLHMALEAMRASGLAADDPAFKKAMAFLQRTQNRSESNDASLELDGVTYGAGDDGGAAYMPGNSPAGYITLADGKKIPRSYGSMSYALLKGYLFAGLKTEDPRVQALWKWLQENYTLDVNPGFQAQADPRAGYQGLFYYFLTMARALELYGAGEIVDSEGQAHDWRAELCGRLCVMQSKVDGSWVNENAPRWWEGNPLLATCYAVLALDAALPQD